MLPGLCQAADACSGRLMGLWDFGALGLWGFGTVAVGLVQGSRLLSKGSSGLQGASIVLQLLVVC